MVTVEKTHKPEVAKCPILYLFQKTIQGGLGSWRAFGFRIRVNGTVVKSLPGEGQGQRLSPRESWPFSKCPRDPRPLCSVCTSGSGLHIWLRQEALLHQSTSTTGKESRHLLRIHSPRRRLSLPRLPAALWTGRDVRMGKGWSMAHKP